MEPCTRSMSLEGLPELYNASACLNQRPSGGDTVAVPRKEEQGKYRGNNLKRRIEDLELRAGVRYDDERHDDRQNQRPHLQREPGIRKKRPTAEKNHISSPKHLDQAFPAWARPPVNQVPTSLPQYSAPATYNNSYPISTKEIPLVWPWNSPRSQSQQTQFPGPDLREDDILRPNPAQASSKDNRQQDSSIQAPSLAMNPGWYPSPQMDTPVDTEIGRDIQVQDAPHPWSLHQDNSCPQPGFEAEEGVLSRKHGEIQRAMQASQFHDRTPTQSHTIDQEQRRGGRNGQIVPNHPTPETLPVDRGSSATHSRKAQSTIGKTTSIDDRIACLLKCARDVGFDSFDAAVTAYYTSSFSETSISHTAQKKSRNRGLPSVLADLRISAKDWTRWEARGYEEEVVRSAESVFVQELDRLAEDQMYGREASDGPVLPPVNPEAAAKRLSATYDTCRIFRRRERSRKKSFSVCRTPRASEQTPTYQHQTSRGSPRDHIASSRKTDNEMSVATMTELVDIKRMLEDELPNLWALMTGLINDTSQYGQPIRAHLALAAITTLCYFGQAVPLTTVLELDDS